MEQEYEYGYLYVFAVSDLPRVKVGYTNTTPQALLSQLNAPNGGSASHRLNYVASWLCRQPAAVEAKVHQRLRGVKAADSVGKEFFDLSPLAATSICNYCVLAHDVTAKAFGLARIEVRALIKGEKKVDEIPEPERARVNVWLSSFSERRSAAWAKAVDLVAASLRAVPPALRPSTFRENEIAQPIFRTLFPELRLIEEIETENPARTGGARVYEFFSEKSDECDGNPLGWSEAFYRALGEPDASRLDDQTLRHLVARFIEIRRNRD